MELQNLIGYRVRVPKGTELCRIDYQSHARGDLSGESRLRMLVETSWLALRLTPMLVAVSSGIRHDELGSQIGFRAAIPHDSSCCSGGSSFSKEVRLEVIASSDAVFALSTRSSKAYA